MNWNDLVFGALILAAGIALIAARKKIAAKSSEAEIRDQSVDPADERSRFRFGPGVGTTPIRTAGGAAALGSVVICLGIWLLVEAFWH